MIEATRKIGYRVCVGDFVIAKKYLQGYTYVNRENCWVGRVLDITTIDNDGTEIEPLAIVATTDIAGYYGDCHSFPVHISPENLTVVPSPHWRNEYYALP